MTRLSLTEFRCYQAARLDVDARPVVLSGPNGAGKTNLLEAISFLAPGRGLRRARLSDVDRRGGMRGWAIAATLVGPDGPTEIGTGRETSGERRVVKVEGEVVRSQAALAEYTTIVWLTPQMDGLFTGSAAARRRFLDRLVFGFDPAHAGRISAYENAMRQRARLLRDGRSDESWLGALEQTMAKRGVAIAAARREMVARLNRACAAGTGPFPKAALEAAGAVETWLGDGPAIAAEDRLKAELAAGRPEDAQSGGASVGPHRSDVRVTDLDTEAPAEQCSTGEQKALLIAIVLADARLRAAERGAAPLLLLDEVAAHLDADRREALFAEICDLGAQTWLTGTDAALFEGLAGEAQFVAVEDAAVRLLS